TTKDAYFYTEENVKDPSKAEKQTFTVAYQAHVTNSEGNEGGALYWFATPFLVMDDYYTVGNGILFRELITNVGDKDVSVSIIGKLMGQTYLQITEQDRTLWTAIIVGVIPAAVLIAGIAVCVIRRRR
ncbi:MAG: hypothetical protein IJD22_07360, partial [Clostridia bacterium]|nr:hypothetical protein [Clostridia bacterium]